MNADLDLDLIFLDTEDAHWQNGECVLTFSDELDAEQAALEAELKGFKVRVEGDKLFLVEHPLPFEHTTAVVYVELKKGYSKMNVWNRFQFTHPSSFVPDRHTWRETKVVYSVGFWRGLLGWLLCLPRRVWSWLQASGSKSA